MKFSLIALFVTSFGTGELPSHTVVQQFQTEGLCIAAKQELSRANFVHSPHVSVHEIESRLLRCVRIRN